MSKLIVDRNIGVKPIYTKEIQTAIQAYWNGTITPEQEQLRSNYLVADEEYTRKERILSKKPCPDCDSSQTYAKSKGTILVCRKCGSESEIEYKN